MLFLHEVLELHDDLSGDAVSSEVRLDLVLGVLQAVRLERGLDLGSVRVGQPQAGGVLRDVLGAPQVTQADGLQEVLVLVDAVQAHAQETVIALVLADAAEVLVASARARPQDALVQVVDQVVLADGQQRLVHGHVDALALARAVGLMQRSQGGGDDHQGVEVVASVGAGVHRLILRAVLAHVAGVGHDGQVVSSALDHLRVAGLAEAGQVHDDELRVDLPQHLVGDALASPGAALGGLDEDVGVGQHLEQDFLAFVREVVQRNGALITALSLLDISGVADGVASAGVLQPRDVGTPVGHEVAGLRHCQLDCCVNDLDVIQNAEGRLVGFKSHDEFLSIRRRACRAAVCWIRLLAA